LGVTMPDLCALLRTKPFKGELFPQPAHAGIS
jgi:hypothetical protein